MDGLRLVLNITRQRRHYGTHSIPKPPASTGVSARKNASVCGAIRPVTHAVPASPASAPVAHTRGLTVFLNNFQSGSGPSGAIPPAPAVQASTGISARLKFVQRHVSLVNLGVGQHTAMTLSSRNRPATSPFSRGASRRTRPRPMGRQTRSIFGTTTPAYG